MSGMLHAPRRPLRKEQHRRDPPQQYELERAYHVYRQQAAAQQRRAAEAEKHGAAHTSIARRADAVASQLHCCLARGSRALGAVAQALTLAATDGTAR